MYRRYRANHQLKSLLEAPGHLRRLTRSTRCPESGPRLQCRCQASRHRAGLDCWPTSWWEQPVFTCGLLVLKKGDRAALTLPKRVRTPGDSAPGTPLCLPGFRRSKATASKYSSKLRLFKLHARQVLLKYRPELSLRAAFFAYGLIIRNSAGVDRLPGPCYGPLDLAQRTERPAIRLPGCMS